MSTSYILRPAECFVVRSGHEWAFIFIDEASGTLAIESSYGRFSHTWTAIGNGPLKTWLHDVTYDYFFGNVASQQGGGKAFDWDKSIIGIKQYLFEQRKEGSLTKEQARDIWLSIRSLEEADTEDGFYRAIYDDHDIGGVLYQWDISGLARKVRDPQCVGFWENLWPVFIEATKPVLAEAA